MWRRKTDRDQTPGWRNSERACALTDGFRHLGHILRVARGWKAFDATHLNRRRTGFKELGIFADCESARAAVEAACAMENNSMKRAAAAGARDSEENTAGGLWIS